MRATTIAVLATAVMVTCAVTACGDDGRADGEVDGGPTAGDGGVDGDGGRTDRDGFTPPAEGCGGDVVAIGHPFTSLSRVTTGRATTGAIQTGTGRLVAFGEHLSPVLVRLPYVELTDEGGVVHSAVVSGDVPEGQLYFTVWHVGLDRFVILSLEREPFRFALHTLELTEASAHFERLEQVATPPGEGLVITDMVALGGDRLYVERGEEVFTVQLGDDTATWSTPTTPSRGAFVEHELPDPQRGRSIGFGASDFDPGTGAITFRPVVYQRSLPSGAWVEIPTFGSDMPEPITSEAGFVDGGWAGYDPAADRLLVALGREVYDEIFMETYIQTGLWAVDLGTGEWSLLVEDFADSSFSYGTAWAVDATHHRILQLGLAGLTALETEGPTAGVTSLLELDGHIGPRRTQAATDLSDGRLLALAGGELVAYDPGASEPRWERFGDVELPRDVREGASIDRDPAGGDVWLFGGASTNASPSMGRLIRIAADGSSSIEPDVTGGPGGRTYHRTLVHDGELFVVGGSADGALLDDVWALDLAGLEWRRVATLPRLRSRPALHVREGELWVVGGWDGDAGVESAVVVDVESGAVRELPVSGAWPARGGIFNGVVSVAGGLVVVDLNDDTLDSDAVTFHFLEPDGEGARWTSLGDCFVDWHVHNVHGVATDDGRAWLVGADLLELNPR